ncbi:MAG: menaquinone biosynthesis protein, partial [Myxococcota bacterium]
IDIGLIPSIEVLRISGVRIVAGTCVAATREVRSVLLLLQAPIEEVRRVAVDSNSRTSIVLLEILMAELWGIEPELVVREADSRGVEPGFDGALLIGDPALRVDRSSFEVVDLAAAWRRLTGLPFVFAVWATRRGLSPDRLSCYFEDSLQRGLADLDRLVEEAADEQGLASSEVRSYLTENLRFVMEGEEAAGLREFFSRAHRQGLAPPVGAALAGWLDLASSHAIS